MNQDELWKTVKDDLQVELSPGTFNAFIAQLTLSDVSESEKEVAVLITAFSPWHQRMVEERFWGQIQEAFERVTGKSCRLRLTAGSGNAPQNAFQSPSMGPLFSQDEEEKIHYHQATQLAKLRPDFTFEQFAVSSTNEMAYAAAQAVSRAPGQAYHLLFLFGGVGVGKTHLMQAIGHRILEKDPETNVIYRSGEEFTNEIIEAIQYKSTGEFRKRYRSVKALLIDDIQFIGGKDKVQEEFFHTFNAIHQENGQIVMTSDQLPQDIVGLEDRLRSRFEGGLVIDIQQPSFELRTAILLIKAKAGGVEFPMEVAQLVAANIESTRSLEGFLKRLTAEGALRHEPLTKEMAERLLGSMKNKSGSGDSVSRLVAVDPSDIFSAVSDVFSVRQTVLKGKRRKKEIVLPRHLAMYMLRNDASLPYEEIGELFGGRDHTTVLHAVEKITTVLPSDERLRGALLEVRKLLKHHGE